MEKNPKRTIPINIIEYVVNKIANSSEDSFGMLMGLIHKKYIKGKIHVEKQILILKKDAAFPVLEYEPYAE